MDKKRVVIFSLLVLALLLIAGCQSSYFGKGAVGQGWGQADIEIYCQQNMNDPDCEAVYGVQGGSGQGGYDADPWDLDAQKAGIIGRMMNGITREAFDDNSRVLGRGNYVATGNTENVDGLLVRTLISPNADTKWQVIELSDGAVIVRGSNRMPGTTDYKEGVTFYGYGPGGTMSDLSDYTFLDLTQSVATRQDYQDFKDFYDALVPIMPYDYVYIWGTESLSGMPADATGSVQPVLSSNDY
ncbi:MAG TPA: hypothetical protein VJJ21_01310 [Candidatus Nanoarchaeia archaeon]|nr:hypothetical protein [Candidatus Nanoarchaeia archaeon]